MAVYRRLTRLEVNEAVVPWVRVPLVLVIVKVYMFEDVKVVGVAAIISLLELGLC